jgi:hypothetical protein
MSELNDFSKWVHGLSHDDLLCAMEFDIAEDEYALWKEMIQLQAPPPTPIHPGILGYRAASVQGATDGRRNEEERVYKARFEKPRLFQLMETTTMPTTLSKRAFRGQRRAIMPITRYNVIARRKITPWGQVLSIGCTQEQRDADDALLKGTRIHHNMNKGRERCMFCTTTGSSKDDVLRMLFVASRGKFLSYAPSSSSSSTPSFCASWLNAQMEWFSLPMFLASRFEVALWSSYRQQRQNNVGGTMSSWLDPIQSAVEKLNASAFQTALLSATVHTLAKDILPHDAALKLIRDGVMWNLFDSSGSEDGVEPSISDTLANVGTVAIVRLDSSRDKFQTVLWSELQEAIAVESEKEILCSLENDLEPPAVATSKRKKGKSKKKKRRGKESKAEQNVIQEESVNLQPRFSSTIRDETMAELHMPLVDPVSIENAKENTRKVIMAGLIVNDILEGVFDQLGLNYPSDEETVDDSAAGTKSKTKAADSRPLQKGKARAAKIHPAKPDAQGVPPVVGGPQMAAEKRNPTEKTLETVAAQIPIEDNKVFPGLPKLNVQNEDPTLTISSTESNQQQDLHLESDFFSVPWMFDETVDGWDKLKRYPNREKSLLADLFLSQKRDAESDPHVASSTAASIASSSDKGSESGDNDSVGGDQKELLDDGERTAPTTPIAPVLEEAVLEAVAASISDAAIGEVPLKTLVTNERTNQEDSVEQDVGEAGNTKDGQKPFDECRSPSPHAPKTPPPQLSPILVSLADLQTIRTRAAPETVESPKALSFSAITAESLPSSPMPPTSTTLTPSWSREDLRINSFTDDQRINSRSKGVALKKRTSAPLSYRNVAAKTLPKARATSGVEGKSPFVAVAPSEARSIPDLRPSVSSRNESDTCAQSETAVEVLSYEVPLNDATRATTRDNTEVTISTKNDSSPKSPPRGHDVAEELAFLRDERNAFRDMCLTLGAEVAKLKNLLAAQSGSSSYVGPAVVPKSPYDPEFMPPYFHGVPKATTTVGAMSDAGTHRGDHDSAFSEDGTDGFGHDASGRPRAVHVRRMSSSATIAGSDLSVEQNVTGQTMLGASSFRDVVGSISAHGMQSRLTTDILNFLRAKSSALRIQDKKKTAAIERLTRLVTALWPRAQVKIYGSHVTGLCLPSSDLDFVICLPAVHKNAPAVAPGALEGRNAINESSQKTLARVLKGESWIDPRSIKIISRTVVPVIKVSTKDTRARTIQLDISFDGPEHHGLAANEMIAEVMQELPMIQPLVLVLKQFLKDRSLLTAYTGGLSSYGLFLMVTRYLQEHPSSWGDCGSLLMGFLDYFGNSFDPRTTGISVRRRQYFARMNYDQSQPMWDFGFPQHITPSPSSSVGGRPDLIRRNSFNENATMDGLGLSIRSVSGSAGPHAPRPPLFQPSSHHRVSHQQYKPTSTFDPLFIEDPLSEGNNVGRNAFRVFQVQRAFSDAHRALVASLEWDIHSSQDVHDGGDYPLLNCLLQSEDVFYELDE